MVNKQIDSISILFDLFALPHLQGVRALLGGNQVPLAVFLGLLVDGSIVDSLFVHELLDLDALLLPLVQRFGIVGYFLVGLFGMLLRSLVSHLQVFARF